ncbi:MAG: polysaccharide biosynthesis protein PslG [Thermoleophilaceae bacterium]|jgi:hypothetical protein|nr:polysaccharide biosynthesis protein PslG [Thermoleophilaceae bacterium]
MTFTPAAIAAPGPIQFGLNFLDHFDGPLTLDEAYRMRFGGATTLRIQFGWGRIRPFQHVPNDWDDYDQTMADAAAAGLDVLPILLGVPDWVPHHQRGWPSSKPGLKAYGKYVKALVGRYGRKGDFWRIHPSLPYHPITTYEVWSEENRADMAPKGNRAKLYAKLLSTTRQALDERDRQAKIMVGGMNQRKIRLSVTATNFLRQLYEVRGVKRNIDLVGLHPYGGRATDPVRIAKSFRRTLRNAGDPKRPIWITELGWGTGGEKGPHPLVVDPAGQANKLYYSFTDLAKHARALGIQRVLWYSFRDILAPSSRGTWDQHAGLFTAAGAKKPGWDAFAFLTGGFAGGDLTPPEPAPEPEPAPAPAP